MEGRRRGSSDDAFPVKEERAKGKQHQTEQSTHAKETACCLAESEALRAAFFAFFLGDSDMISLEAHEPQARKAGRPSLTFRGVRRLEETSQLGASI